MIRSRKRYPGPGGMLVCSLLMHLALLLALTTFQLLPSSREPEQTTYYVDMVSLPVASPQAGTPAPVSSAPKPRQEAPPVAPPSEPAAMTLPAQPHPKAQKAPAKVAHKAPAVPEPSASAKSRSRAKAQEPSPPQKQARQPGPSDESREIDDRMAKLERQVEDRRLSETLDRLKKRGNGRQGSPGGKGSQAGSDYSAYIYARIKDAFDETFAAQTRAPQVKVRITIGTDGRMTQYRVEQYSGDKMFDDAVDRAVHIAERSFRKPPSGVPFEQGFVFRPQGVGVR